MKWDIFPPIPTLRPIQISIYKHKSEGVDTIEIVDQGRKEKYEFAQEHSENFIHLKNFVSNTMEETNTEIQVEIQLYLDNEDNVLTFYDFPGLKSDADAKKLLDENLEQMYRAYFNRYIENGIVPIVLCVSQLARGNIELQSLMWNLLVEYEHYIKPDVDTITILTKSDELLTEVRQIALSEENECGENAVNVRIRTPKEISSNMNIVEVLQKEREFLGEGHRNCFSLAHQVCGTNAVILFLAKCLGFTLN